MDAHTGKRSEGGPITDRKGRSVASKDAATARDENVQFCNRIGCRGRIKYSRDTNCGTLDKFKCSRPFCFSNGNKIVGTSVGRNSVLTSAKKLNLDSKRELSSQSESGESGYSFSKSLTYHSKLVVNDTAKITVAESGNSNVSSNFRSQKPSIPPSSSVFSVSKSIGPGPSKISTLSRHSSRNLKLGSTSDVVSLSCSLVSKSIGKNVMKRRGQEKENNSSSSGRTPSVKSSVDKHVSPPTSSNSSRTSCTFTFGGDRSAASSVRTRSSGNINRGMRLSRRNGQNFSSIREPAKMETPNNEFSSGSSSYSVSSSNGDNLSTLMSFSSEDLGSTHLRNRHALPQYSQDGIAEVLLALERIEQDAMLTHVQVLALEASFFRSRLNLYDQHRDMRLDIDNMACEELLALEERMGTVSTALSEETLSKCIRKSIRLETPLEVQDTGSSEDGDDIKCSICQEEFELGDEVGTLIECNHGYHITCINQWLRLKNWCPICKASAVPSKSSPSL